MIATEMNCSHGWSREALEEARAEQEAIIAKYTATPELYFNSDIGLAAARKKLDTVQRHIDEMDRPVSLPS